jgi:hypothetical protein
MAARNGDTLISTNVLATVVRVSEPMKKKNVPARSAPATRPGADGAHHAGHRAAVHHVSTSATNADMKSERQNTISHALVMESARTSKPPVDQQSAPAIIMSTARRWRDGMEGAFTSV